MTQEEDHTLLHGGHVEQGVLLAEPVSHFEAIYRQVRAAERRILTDEQVRALPDGEGLWNAPEWRIRERSAARLVRELSRYERPLTVLEVGCGNGWLCGLLHRQGHTVVGIDTFTEELEQAARLFRGPLFARADLFRSTLAKASFDVIVFAASFQYFHDGTATIKRCMELLTADGEVHILDTILYGSKAASAAAVDRSRSYYASLGFPEMAQNYHAHELALLRTQGKLSVLTAPSGMERTLKRFGRPCSPFTHVVIRPQ